MTFNIVLAVKRGLPVGTLVAVLLANGTGCSDSSNGGPTGDFQHLYAAASITWADDGTNTGYLSLLPNLQQTTVDLDDAIEFPGWPGIYARNGKLFVSDGEKPTLTRYQVDQKGTFIKEKAVSFMAHGAEYANADFVDDARGYMLVPSTGQGIVWNADQMAVTGTFELPHVDGRAEGMEYGGIGNGRSFVARGNRAYVATNWANWDTYRVSEDGLIAVIDTEKDMVIKMISAPCPYLDVATVDDDGYTYFSNWTYSISQTLLEGKKKACVVRIAPGADELDTTWSLTFADVTGGHEGAALRYMGDGKAAFVAYDESRIEGGIANYTEESPGDLADKSNWKVWMVDLKTRTATPVQGLDWTSGGYYLSRVDEGAFILAPDDEYTTTSFYKVSSGGTAELKFKVDGWVLDLVQVR